jgi:hypothetical protein
MFFLCFLLHFGSENVDKNNLKNLQQYNIKNKYAVFIQIAGPLRITPQPLIE